MDKERIMAGLALIYKSGDIAENVPMSLHTSFKAGGPAAIMVQPGCAEELSRTIDACRTAGVDYYIIGNGTNLIVTDEGYDGLIIKIGDRMAGVSVRGDCIFAGAGALLSSVAKYAADQGLAGMEFASGIPGSVGGGVAMNAGAYGGELGDILEEIVCLDIRNGIRKYGKEELVLSYRHSVCQEQPLIVLSAVFGLKRDGIDGIKSRMRQYNRLRNEKQPVQWPSAGSVFKRPEGHFAGRLIEDAGLKGLALGGARISPMHAGFIINEKNATADDILKLIELVKLTVYDSSGIRLQEEVKVIGKRTERL